MAKKKKNSDVDESQSVYDCDSSVELENSEHIDIELLNVYTKACKIIRLTSKAIQIDFNGYGISVKTNNADQYKDRKMIRVNYTGEFGTPDFKTWIDK